MAIEQKELDVEGSESQAVHVENLSMDLHAINFPPKALEPDRSISLITQMTWMVGDQILKGLEPFE